MKCYSYGASVNDTTMGNMYSADSGKSARMYDSQAQDSRMRIRGLKVEGIRVQRFKV